MKKKKQPIDATLRNVRAAKKRESKLEKRIKELEERVMQLCMLAEARMCGEK